MSRTTPKTKSSPRAKSSSKPRAKRTPKPKPVEFVYWAHEGMLLYEALTFVYEIHFYRGTNRMYQLFDSKTSNSDTFKLKTAEYIQHKGYYEVKSYTLLGAPIKWLEQNKFVKNK